MNCSVCGKEIVSGFSPVGDDRIYCADCDKIRLQEVQNSRLTCARFQKCNRESITALKYLTGMQIERHQQRIAAGKEKCMECKTRQSCKDDWQTAEFPEIGETKL